jgi:hypothetical protein
MPLLLAPVLAQAVILHLADRTEARYLDYGDEVYEASTAPAASLRFDWRRASLALGYAPSFTLTPLEEKPRDLLVYHQFAAGAGYRWRRSSLKLSSAYGFGGVNFRAGGLRGSPVPTAPSEPAPSEPGQTPGGEQAPPGPQTPTPGDPNNGQLRIADENVRYYTTTTSLSYATEFTKELRGEAHIGHMRGGGLDTRSRELYPSIRSWFAGASSTYDYLLTAKDSFATTVGLEGSISEAEPFGATALVLTATEGWRHTFDSRTLTGLTAGINITRFTQGDGLQGFSVFPNFQGWFAHQERLWGGLLGLGVYAYSAPTLDPLRALVDPRLGGGAAVTYTRKRFTVGIDGGAAVSLSPPQQAQSSIDTAQAQAKLSYAVSDYVSADTGARYWRQGVGGQVVIPSSWSAFVGLTLGYEKRLSSGH